MKTKILSLIALILCSSYAIADDDFKSCTIETMSGETIECLAKLNFFSISYKVNPNDKPSKMKSKEVRYATFCENDSCYIVTGMPVVTASNTLKGKTKGMNVGFQIFHNDPKTEKLSVASYMQQYGNMFIRIYCFHKLGNDFTTFTFSTHTYDRSATAKKSASYYMADCPEILSYVSNKDTKIKKMEDFVSLVEEYNICVNNK